MTETLDPQTRQICDWLRTQALPLATVEAGHGFADLQPLKAILADVRLVGLGEATHGTREFFQCKHRLMEFLVVELGFTVFTLEASWSACQNINDYVLYGAGSRAAALASQGFWTWDTEEVAEFIDWLRAHNLTQPPAKRVRFYGYDVQVIGGSITAVRDYLGRYAPDCMASVEPALTALTNARRDAGTGDNTPASKAAITDLLLQMIGQLSAHRLRLIRASGSAEYEAALQHARICLQQHESYGKPVTPTELCQLRDLYMAENIEYIARVLEPDAKIAVWAHNGHVFTGSYMAGVTSMGEHLRRMFGPSYYVFGFTFNQGSFQSRRLLSGEGEALRVGPLEEFTVGPVPAGLLEWHFVAAGVSDCILDLRSGPQSGPVCEWLRNKQPMRTYDELYSPDWPAERSIVATVPREYDALIYVADTTRSRPTSTGRR